jgi:steroid delta-isomerase
MASRQDIVAACDRYLEALSQGDVDGIMALYAEQPTVEDPVGSPEKLGRAAVREFYEGAVTIPLKATRLGPVTVAADRAAFLFRIDVTVGDQQIALASTDVMTFDEQGKVVAMVAIPDADAFDGEPTS